jgi:branched-chain amino acid transport system ATP-binding protein
MKLEISDLRVSYGGIKALKGISLTVEEGQIVTLIGANGAGKSTTLRSISGLLKADGGSIVYNGENILGAPAKEIVRRGIVMVPEGRRVFPDMSVRENLLIGAFVRKDRPEIEKDMDYVYSLFPRLKERAWQMAGTLSGGEQQMLAVGRALMSRPKLLIMDEPSLGLAPLVVRDIFGIIRRVNGDGITVLLIEQNANAALRVAHYGYVLETGSIVLEGPGSELLVNPSVQEAYLGKRRTKAPRPTAAPQVAPAPEG